MLRRGIMARESLPASFLLWIVVFIGINMSQLSPFDIGQVKAHLHHGLKGAAISRIMVKADGKSRWSEQAIQDAIKKLESNPKWRGEPRHGCSK